MTLVFNTIVNKQVIVEMKHIRAANLCRRGTQEWFGKHGIPWSDFLTNGTPATVLEATGDPLALRVAEIARREAENG